MYRGNALKWNNRGEVRLIGNDNNITRFLFMRETERQWERGCERDQRHRAVFGIYMKRRQENWYETDTLTQKSTTRSTTIRVCLFFSSSSVYFVLSPYIVSFLLLLFFFLSYFSQKSTDMHTYKVSYTYFLKSSFIRCFCSFFPLLSFFYFFLFFSFFSSPPSFFRQQWVRLWKHRVTYIYLFFFVSIFRRKRYICWLFVRGSLLHHIMRIFFYFIHSAFFSASSKPTSGFRSWSHQIRSSAEFSHPSAIVSSFVAREAPRHNDWL